MKKQHYYLSLLFGVLAIAVLLGCKQESPAGKTTEAAGQAAVDAIKTPMDEARQAESKLGKSAEQTAAEIKKSTQ